MLNNAGSSFSRKGVKKNAFFKEIIPKKKKKTLALSEMAYTLAYEQEEK